MIPVSGVIHCALLVGALDLNRDMLDIHDFGHGLDLALYLNGLFVGGVLVDHHVS